MNVRDVMTVDPVTLDPEDRLVDAEEQMGLRGFRHVPVVDKGRKLLGMLSQVDVARAAVQGGLDPRQQLIHKAQVRVREVMATRLDTVGPDEELVAVARTLRASRRACLPVVEDGVLVGILTEADFVKLVAVAFDGAPPNWLQRVKADFARSREG